jgi:4-hydroxy-tetrahydrodipicolinate reductase
MRIGVFGTGRLGSAIAGLAGSQLAWQVSREAPPPSPVDAAIEATVAARVQDRVDWALATGTQLLIGTTGWLIPDLEALVNGRIGVLVAPNFSLTMALYARLSLILARFSALSEDRDPYLVEHHHARKHDAPSGTAKQLAATLIKGCPRKTEWVIPAIGASVAPHQLNVSSIRAGHTYSSHIVGVDGPGEVIELHHSARSALPYAEGALLAAQWMAGRKGVFRMDDVARETLNPLFQEVQP